MNKLPNLESKFHFADKQVKFAAPEDGKGTTILKKDGDEATYTFHQFHFHSPSEHTLDGEHYDAEVHFVHINEDDPDDLLVIGVLLDTDSGNWKSSVNFFDKFKFDEWVDWGREEAEENTKINIKKFLNEMDDKTFWHYPGSLTTPPCSEGVNWFLMRQV